MVLANVIFSAESPHLPIDELTGCAEGNKNFIVGPLPKDPESSEDIYRIGFNVPLSAGSPPSNPFTSYLQQYLDEQGPFTLSSDPPINPQPIHIAKTIWATRFRTHAAIADQFLVRAGYDEDSGGGIVVLIGDAAHIHAPAGRWRAWHEPWYPGHFSILAAHVASVTVENNKRLKEYVGDRRERALSTIKFTKRILGVATIAGSNSQLYNLGFWIVRLLPRVQLTKRRLVRNLSGPLIYFRQTSLVLSCRCSEP